jgi:hypothetical protein
MKGRKEGYYWCIFTGNGVMKPVYWDGNLWRYSGDFHDDDFFLTIYETIIPTPQDEPSCFTFLEKAIRLINQKKLDSLNPLKLTKRGGDYRIGLTAAIDILENLKDEL